MSATHRQGLGPVVGDLFLDSDVPACERVTVSRNGWSAEVTHLWTGHGWTRLVPGPVHRVPAQPLVTRSTQPPVSSPVGTRRRSSKKTAPPAPLQPPARRVPVRQVRPAEPGAIGPADAQVPAATAAPGAVPPEAAVPGTGAAEVPARARGAAAPPAAVTDEQAPVQVEPEVAAGPEVAALVPGAAVEPPLEQAAEDAPGVDAPVDVVLPATPLVPRQPASRTPDAGGARRPVRHASRR